MPLPASIPSQGGFRLPWLTLGLAVLSAGLYIWPGPAPEWLLYSRDGLGQGELWRLVTGHLVHADPVHLAWNLGALLLLGACWELSGGGRRSYLALLLLGALAIDAWLWLAEPQLTVYCGLSGVLNALYAGLLLRLWQRLRQPVLLLALLADLAKIGLEAGLGGALLATGSWTSVPGAHLAGLAVGVLFVMAAHWPRSEARAIARARAQKAWIVLGCLDWAIEAPRAFASEAPGMWMGRPDGRARRLREQEIAGQARSRDCPGSEALAVGDARG